MTEPMSLAAALDVISPRRSDEAYLVLTVCCAYLQTGATMPGELRRWLDRYLTNERRQLKAPRSLRMANLEVVRRRAERDGAKLSRAQAEFANALGLDESTVKKWRSGAKYRAVNAVRDHLDDVLTRTGNSRG